jgi:hypothetical protein
MQVYNDKGVKTIKQKGQDKGHSKEFDLVLEAISQVKAFPISFEEIYHSSLLTLEAIRSINENRMISIEN